MSGERTAMAPRLESPSKELVVAKVDVVEEASPMVVDTKNNNKDYTLSSRLFAGTPERGGYETTAGLNNQVLVQDSSESAASSPRDDALVVAPPLPWELDAFGFIRHLQQVTNNVVESVDQQRQERRVQKWNVMLAQNNLQLLKKRRSKLLLRRLRKGVPHSVRPAVWTALCQTQRRQQALYDKLVLESTQFVAQDRESLSEKELAFCKIQDTIERDIHRTFPRHSLFYDKEEVNDSFDESTQDNCETPTFCDTTSELRDMIRDLELDNNTNVRRSSVHHPDERSAEFVLNSQGGQASLRRILKAYSVYDKEIGYCQGMNFIAGMFLTLVPEEEAFWMLVSVMSDEPCHMRGLFAEGMRETHMVLFVAEKLVHHFLPRLAKHLDKEHIHVTMYATQWLLTQYTSSFPFNLVLRVWDCFLGEGWKITYRVMLSILQQHQSQLLRMSFEEILAFLRELPSSINGPVVVDAAIKIPLRRKHVTKFEQQWHAQQHS